MKAIFLLLVSIFRIRSVRMKTKAVKKYPEYPGVDDEWIDAVKALADGKVNQRFLS